ncbi:MAG: DJ-1/PfpI family protein [Candidatus Margulisiibacteriota bacterium]
MPKIALIIAFERFRDEEYTDPKQVLEQAGFTAVTVSSALGTATGKLGMKAKVDITLEQVIVQDYAAILFIGGPGSFSYYDNPICHKIAQDTLKAGKVLGAICAAPGILAKAGVLKGKKATMFDDTGVLGENGATYTGNGVEIDGNIITATGPVTAKAWTEAIIKATQ